MTFDDCVSCTWMGEKMSWMSLNEVKTRISFRRKVQILAFFKLKDPECCLIRSNDVYSKYLIVALHKRTFKDNILNPFHQSILQIFALLPEKCCSIYYIYTITSSNLCSPLQSGGVKNDHEM